MKKAVSIIVVCGLLLSIGTVYVFAVDAPIQSSNVNYTLYTDSSDNSQMICSISWDALRPYFIDTNYAFETNQGQEGAATVAQDFVVLIRFTNRTNKNLFCNYSSCTINFPLQRVDTSVGPFNYGSSYSEFSGNLFSGFRLNSNGNTFTFSWNPDFQYGLGVVVPAKQTLYCYFVYTQYSNPDFSNQPYMWDDPSIFAMQVNSSNVSIGYPTTSQVNPINNFTVSDVGYNTLIQNDKIDALYNQLVGARSTLNSIDSTMSHIDSNVQTIIDNWAAQSNQASNVTSETSDVMTTNDTIHSSEAQWYSDNSAALQSVGLSNYQYSQDVTTGFSNISTLFSNLWNSLGSWNTVYTFSMMIGLVMLILRHAPQRRKRSSGGKSDG